MVAGSEEGDRLMAQEYTLQPSPRLRTAKNVFSEGVEGAWTPILQFNQVPTDYTYSTQQGYYRLTGNLVFMNFKVAVTGANTKVGNAEIGGMPFIPEDISADLFIIRWDQTATNWVNMIGRTPNPTDNFIYITGAVAAADSNSAVLQETDFKANSSIQGSGFFRISNRT
jgi:hypothetical protein